MAHKFPLGTTLEITGYPLIVVGHPTTGYILKAPIHINSIRAYLVVDVVHSLAKNVKIPTKAIIEEYYRS
jgi:hypothetical protein